MANNEPRLASINVDSVHARNDNCFGQREFQKVAWVQLISLIITGLEIKSFKMVYYVFESYNIVFIQFIILHSATTGSAATVYSFLTEGV